MKIQLSDAGKRFNRDWIFRKMAYTFTDGDTYAITGPNGSGKSTLLQVLGGSTALSQGQISWNHNGISYSDEAIFSEVAMVAPYLEVIEEFTAIEFLLFHQHFKPLQPGKTIQDILAIVGLERSAKKQIRYYSSGMKQRIKLAQAVFSEAPLLLLDEPCTNLDKTGYDLYQELMHTYTRGKTIVISSNDVNEYSFCNNVLSIADFK